MFDKKNTRIALAFTAIGIVIGIVVTLSFTMYSPPANSALSKEECTRESNCVILPINDSQYMLKGEGYKAWQDCQANVPNRNCDVHWVNDTIYLLEGEAYQAYQDFENIASPLHTITLESKSLPSNIPYLINVDGPTEPVQSLITEYNITRSAVKVHPDGNYTSFYGWIYKQNLARFLDENKVESLKAKSLYVYPVAGYSDENGTVNRVPFPIPENLTEEHQAFREAEITRILTEKTGVTRISNEDFFPVD